MLKTYTNEERLTLLKAYFASGKGKCLFAREHGITATSLNQWLERYNCSDALSVETKLLSMKIPDDVSALQAEIARLRREKQDLEKELERESYRRKASELMIDLAESTYHIKIRKNSAAK